MKLLSHQLDFVNDTTSPDIALVGGYGCGKTVAVVAKAIKLASLNVGYAGMVTEPTYGMIEDTLKPTFDLVLDQLKIRHTYRATRPAYTLHFRTGEAKISLRSTEKAKNLLGMNLAFVFLDEADLVDPQIGKDIYRITKSRIRAGNIRQFGAVSTPEGFGFMYKTFEENPGPNTRLIRGCSYDNHHLPEGFVDSILSNYSEEQAQAYIYGRFVNLTSGTVYRSFDRNDNNTTKTLNDFDAAAGHNVPLHIGIDFNVGKCCGIVHVVAQEVNEQYLDPRTNNVTDIKVNTKLVERAYAIGEITGMQDTETLINRIDELYPNREIHVYPDASSRARKTNAAITDLQLLKQAGYKVHNNNKNPAVKDRVNTMNAMFRNANGAHRYYVNGQMCPEYTKCLEQQAWKNGEPDKSSDLDHPLDAAGYFITKRFPLTNNNRSQPLRLVGI